MITIEQYGLGRFIKGEPSPEDIQAAGKGLERIENIIDSREYHVVILEEANVAVTCELFSVQELLRIIDKKPDDLELVITGRNASPEIIERADLVTEMKEIKHYYHKGVQRQGWNREITKKAPCLAVYSEPAPMWGKALLPRRCAVFL